MVNSGVHDSVGGDLKGSPKHKRTMPTVSFSPFFFLLRISGEIEA